MMLDFWGTLLSACAFGYMAFLSAINLFERVWVIIVTCAVPFALIFLGSALYNETLLLIGIGFSVALFILALIKRKLEG